MKKAIVSYWMESGRMPLAARLFKFEDHGSFTAVRLLRNDSGDTVDVEAGIVYKENNRGVTLYCYLFSAKPIEVFLSRGLHTIYNEAEFLESEFSVLLNK